MAILRWGAALLLVLGIPGMDGAAAQDDEIIPHRVFTSRDGLPGEHITAIAQTPDGVLWVGTTAGLAYFDGYRYWGVTLPDARGNASVASLLATAENTLWVTTTRQGVWHLSADRQPRKVAALGDEYFHTVLPRGSSTYLFGLTKTWAFDEHAGRPRELRYAYEVTTHALARSSFDGAGGGPSDAVVATDGRLVLLDGILGPRFFEPDRTGAPGVEHRGSWNAIARDAGGHLWAVDYERGLFRLDRDLAPELVLAAAGSHHLLIDGAVAYIAGRSGVLRFDIDASRQLEPLGRNVGLPITDARVTFVDQEGSLWIGSRSRLVHVPRLHVRHVKHLQGEPLLNVAILAPANNGELWASSYGAGLVRLTPTMSIEQTLQFNRWNTVTDSPDGQLFAIGGVGVSRRDGAHWRPALSIPGAVRGVAGHAGTIHIWKDHGVFQYSLTDGTSIRLYEWAVDERSYHALGAAPDGSALIRSHDLLLRARVDQVNSTVSLDTLARLEGLERSGSRFLVQDDLGAVWIGFWDRGLVRVSGGALTTVLADVNVRGINLSGDSLLLASTGHGLYGFDVRTQQLIFSLAQEDGLISDATSGAAIVGGVLYVAHATGVSKLPLGEIGRGHFGPLRVHLTPAGSLPGAAHTSQLTRDASFRYFATPYVDPDGISYEYRLGDDEWGPAEGNVLQVYGLSGGSHALEVRARYREGDPGPVASYAFSVPTPYYQATWFRLLLMAALLLIGGLAYIARFKTLRNRAAELKMLVDERTYRLAEAMHTTERQANLLRQHDELKTRFFTNISHEFRTPLTLIRGLVNEVVQGRHGSLHQEVEERLSTVSANTERLTRLVEDLLELSRLEAGQTLLTLAPGDLVATVDDTVHAHAPAAERAGVSLSSRTETEAYPAVFDAGAIDKIVSNLLSNAVKHTPPGGHIHLSFSVDPAACRAVIAVRDDGEGIPESLLPHIFDRFVLGEEEAGSSGIGLAMVKELVELHDGTIDVESEVDRGACFTVSLPIARQDRQGDGFGSNGLPFAVVQERLTREVHRIEAAPDAAQVLVVDDNPDIRAYVASHLARDYHVRQAADGAEALALAREAKPALIISDVMMPGMSGDELCRELRADESLADVPVILLTARAGGQGAVAGLEAGADAYVEKPFHMDALLARVERLLASRKALKDSYVRHMVIDGLEVEVDSADEALLKQLFEIVDARIAETTFGVEDLAVEMGLSPRHLRRRIREATGESPAELLRRYRLEVAARLLAGGAASVAEAGYRVGYGSPAAFGNQFKKQFGVNPSDYAATP